MRAIWPAVAVLCGLGAAGCGEEAEEEASVPQAARAVSTSVCSPVTYGGEGRPRLVVPLVGPLQNAASDHGIQNAQAVKLVLQDRGWKAGPHTVGIQVCDEASADQVVDLAKCRRNARAFIRAAVVAVVGPSVSGCAVEMVPILNAAPDGPIPLLGIGNTYVGLTRAGPGVQHDSDSMYPTGRRSYLRTVPADDAQAAAAVILARAGGARRPYAVHDGEAYGQALAGSFVEAAARAGLTPAGTARWDPGARGYTALARRIRRARADAVYLAGVAWNNAPRLVRDLRAGLGDRVALLAPDGFNQPTAIVEGAGARAEDLTITLAAAPVRALPEAGRRWAARFRQRWGASPCCYAVHAGQVMSLLLDAIAGSDGTRAEVLRHLQRARVRGGLVGDFSFDRFGDTSLTTIAAYRIRGGRLHFVRTLDVPRELLTRR